MAPSPSLPQRLLYYYSQLYSSQLARGDDYSKLCPTISICFVNGRLFPDRSSYHRRFRLFDPQDSLLLTEDLDMHLLELSNFECSLAELRNPLDFWLYFLKNGEALDADALPTPLDTRELHQAMEVLKMFSQDEMARELYEGRLKAKRDEMTREREVSRARAELSEMHHQLAEAQERRAEAQQQAADAQQQAVDAQQQAADAQQQAADAQQQAAGAQQQAADAQQQAAGAQQRAADAQQQAADAQQQAADAQQRAHGAEWETRQELALRIRLCERLLGRPSTDPSQLLHWEVQMLRELADQLAQKLTAGGSGE